MVSFDFVTERIATGGGIASKEDVDQLVAQGITHIIDMRAEFDDDALADQRVAVLWLPQQDDGTPRPAKQVLAGIQFALSALAQPGHKIFCHCASVPPSTADTNCPI